MNTHEHTFNLVAWRHHEIVGHHCSLCGCLEVTGEPGCGLRGDPVGRQPMIVGSAKETLMLLPLGTPWMRRVLDRIAEESKREDAALALTVRHQREREAVQERQQRERDELMDRR